MGQEAGVIQAEGEGGLDEGNDKREQQEMDNFHSESQENSQVLVNRLETGYKDFQTWGTWESDTT